MDVGYHGKGYPFSACLIDGERICGCGWPLDVEEAKKSCVPMRGNETVAAATKGSIDVISAAARRDGVPLVGTVATFLVLLWSFYV